MGQELDYFGQIQAAIFALSRMVHKDEEVDTIEVGSVLKQLNASQQYVAQIVIKAAIEGLRKKKHAPIPALSAVNILTELKQQLETGWEKHGDHFIIFIRGLKDNPTVYFGALSLVTDKVEMAVRLQEGNGHTRTLAQSELKALPDDIVAEITAYGIAATQEGLAELEKTMGIQVARG